MILQAKPISKSFGETVVFSDIAVKIEDQDRIGLIGMNGAGKTTLLNVLAGQLEPDNGEVMRGKDVRIGYLKQNMVIESGETVYAAMQKVFASVLEAQNAMHQLEKQMAAHPDHDSADYREISENYARQAAYFEAQEGYLLDVKIKTVLHGMGFSEETYDASIATLSGGEKTRLALAKLLLEAPNLLILDEPTNHLDFQTLTWLESYLQEYRGALLIVSHDRYFLDRMVGRIWELGHETLWDYTGNYTKYKQLKQERLVRQQKEYEQQQNKIHSLEAYIQANGVRASTAASAKSRQKQLDQMVRIEKPCFAEKTPHFSFTNRTSSGKEVLTVSDLVLEVGEPPKRLCDSVSFGIERGERVALIGQNGVGKSTLLQTVLERLPLAGGSFRWGYHVTTSYYAQENQTLNFDNTVIEELWGRFPHMSEYQIRTILGGMLLGAEDIGKQVRVLSGGERARLSFAIMVTEHANTLLLDEPTNHLDLASKEELEKAMLAFGGTQLFVSHDRYLLNTVPTKIMELTPHGIRVYEGNYDAYLAQKALEAPEQPLRKPEPKRSEGGQAYHRSKKERSAQVQRKNRIQKLEQLMEQLEQEIAALEAQIADPAYSSDYQALEQACKDLEDKRNQQDETMDEWMLLQEEE